MLVCSVLIISRLDSQSKFQMLTLFSGRHIGVPRMYTNMAFPCSVNFCETFQRVLGERTGLKLGEMIYFVVFYNIKIS